MTNTIIPERLPLIDQIQPVWGSAPNPGDQTPEQACVMQMAAWLTGEQWTDRPACVDPRLAALLRDVNDNLPEDVLSTWAPQVAPLTVGVTDASELLDRLTVRRLRESVLPLAPSWPEEVRGQAVAAVEQVIAAIESGDRDSHHAAAELAAQASKKAALTARAAQSGDHDARHAARAARMAMWAAQSAYSSVWWAAQAAQAAQAAARSDTETASWSVWAAARSAARLSEQSTWEAAAATWVAEANRIRDELRAAKLHNTANHL